MATARPPVVPPLFRRSYSCPFDSSGGRSSARILERTRMRPRHPSWPCAALCQQCDDDEAGRPPGAARFVQPHFLRELADKELAIDAAAARAEMERLEAREGVLRMEQEGIDESTLFLCLHPRWRTTARAHSPLRDGAAPDEGVVFLPLAALPPQRPPPLSARSRAQKLTEEHKRKARERHEAAERLAERHAAQRNAALARRRRAAASKEALRRTQHAREMAEAMAEAHRAKAAAEARSVAEEAKARAWMRRVLEAEEARREVDRAQAAAAAAATSAHERWKAFRDTSAGRFDGDEWAVESEDEEDEEDGVAEVDEGGDVDGEAEEDQNEGEAAGGGGGGGKAAAGRPREEEWVTEEVLERRALKEAERDACLRRVLDKGTRHLRAALGLRDGAAPDDVAASARRQLRLLHPDFGINLPLKGTKAHRRIELAFKKLNGLKLLDGTL